MQYRHRAISNIHAVPAVTMAQVSFNAANTHDTAIKQTILERSRQTVGWLRGVFFVIETFVLSGWYHFVIFWEKNPFDERKYIRSNQYIMMTSSNGNIFRITGPLWREFTGDRWISLTKAIDAKLWCFLWSAPQNGWANNRDTSDSRCHRAHYDATVTTYVFTVATKFVSLMYIWQRYICA